MRFFPVHSLRYGIPKFVTLDADQSCVAAIAMYDWITTTNLTLSQSLRQQQSRHKSLAQRHTQWRRRISKLRHQEYLRISLRSYPIYGLELKLDLDRHIACCLLTDTRLTPSGPWISHPANMILATFLSSYSLYFYIRLVTDHFPQIGVLPEICWCC